MSEITVNTGQVVDALIAKLDTSTIIMQVSVAVDREVKRIVTQEVRTSIKDAVRAAVADAMPALNDAIKVHVDAELKVRARRFSQRLERASADE